MGWNVVLAQQVWELWEEGAFDGHHSVIEFAPHDLGSSTGRHDVYARFAKARFGECDKTRAFEREAYDDNGQIRPMSQKAFYKLFGITDYSCVDYLDERADLNLNLNDPIEIDRTYDVVVDFGTSEHLFNIGQSFQNAYNLLRPGGLVLYHLPVMGQIHHGFYNIHLVLYRSLVAAGLYESVRMRYFHSLPTDLRKARTERDMIFPVAHDFSERDPHRTTFKFYFNDIWQVLTGGHRTAAMVFVALRKIDNKPFQFPQQVNKYWVPPETT